MFNVIVIIVLARTHTHYKTFSLLSLSLPAAAGVPRRHSRLGRCVPIIMSSNNGKSQREMTRTRREGERRRRRNLVLKNRFEMMTVGAPAAARGHKNRDDDDDGGGCVLLCDINRSNDDRGCAGADSVVDVVIHAFIVDVVVVDILVIIEKKTLRS